MTLKRNPDYWGRDLADEPRLLELRRDPLSTIYRDANSHFEAFKKGLYDISAEHDPGRWETAYDFPAAARGAHRQGCVSDRPAEGSLAFVFNTRRPLFADIRVREAIALLFDFEWVNHNFFFDRYRRTGSYFEDSDSSARGRPADDRERALLAPLSRTPCVPTCWRAPGRRRSADGSGRDRATLRQRARPVRGRGYELEGTELRERASGKPFAFEILVVTKDQERLGARLSARPQARRDRGARPPGRCGAVSTGAA